MPALKEKQLLGTETQGSNHTVWETEDGKKMPAQATQGVLSYSGLQ